MATIDEFAWKNIGLWWRYGISRHCDEWKYIIIGRIFESEIICIPPSLKISESSSNGSYRNTDEVWWRYGISRSCDEWIKRVGRLTPTDNHTAISGPIFFMYGLKFAETLQFYKFVEHNFKRVEIWTLNKKVYKTVCYTHLPIFRERCSAIYQ
jgi:hypothetical protein